MKFPLITSILICFFSLVGCSTNQESISDKTSNKQVYNDSIKKQDFHQDIPNEKIVRFNHHFNFDSLYRPDCPCVINKLNEEIEIDSIAIKKLPYDSDFTDFYHIISLGLIDQTFNYKLIAFKYSRLSCPVDCPGYIDLVTFTPRNKTIDSLTVQYYNLANDILINVNKNEIKLDSIFYELSEDEGPSGLPERKGIIRKSNNIFNIDKNGMFIQF